MPQTYNEHLTTVEEAYPTPDITWYLHEDDVGHPHDDAAVAQGEFSWMGETFIFEAHMQVGTTVIIRYTCRYVKDENLPRIERLVGSNGVTWSVYKRDFNTSLGRFCERERDLMALEALVQEILAEDGIVAAPLPPGVLSPVATLSGIAPNAAMTSSWALDPVFDADTLVYEFFSTATSFLPIATLGHSGQTVYWKHKTNAYIGTNPVGMTLDEGANTVTATVVSEDGMHLRVYTLTVRKTS